MKLRNFYIFFPIILSFFMLFVLKYKFQSIFISKYIISQKKQKKAIEKYVSQTTQNFILEVTNLFLPFKEYLKYILEDFKYLENNFSKTSYRAFHYSKNQTQINGLITDKVFYGIFEKAKNKIFFSFLLNKTTSKPIFFIYYFKLNNSSFLKYNSSLTKKSFFILKENNTYLISYNNQTRCFFINQTPKVLPCDSMENLLIEYDNLYQNLKYEFLKIFEVKRK